MFDEVVKSLFCLVFVLFTFNLILSGVRMFRTCASGYYICFVCRLLFFSGQPADST